MTLKQVLAFGGAALVLVAGIAVTFTLARVRDEPLPIPQHGRTKCAFPEMDFHGLEIGLPYAEVRKRYADHTAHPSTLVNGCIAYRYDSYLFAEGAPTTFITLQFADGLVKAKWLQSREPGRPECSGGIAAVVDVGDIIYEHPIRRR
jgi:hypothetical protein